MKKFFGLLISFCLLISTVACTGTSNIGVPENGTVDVFLYLEGGSGRASVVEETTMTTTNGESFVLVTWSSSNYDYMIVEDEKYLPINTEGNSTFEIPVLKMDEPFEVIADTTAMSQPHEITYTLTVSTVKLTESTGDENIDTETESVSNSEIENWVSNNLSNPKAVEIQYANEFLITEYNDDNYIALINDTDYYLITPRKAEDFKDLPEDLTLISTSLKNIYVVGSGSMDYFVASDSLDLVKYTSLQADDWYLDDVKEMVENGDIIYAGKYSSPDYEMLLAGNCDLIVENTMINHSTNVLTQLKALGFPVLIDYSSYENSILGRMEWVKLYGLLTGNLRQATEAFEEQKSNVESMELDTESKKTIGFFSINSAGNVTIRKSDDYVCNMIELAGGEYGFSSLDDIEGTGSTTIQAEAFYEQAKDCDILIYNSTIDGEISSKEELVEKFKLIKNCKAYSDDEIYCTRDSFYQAVMEMGEITVDINKILNGNTNLEYLEKIK